MASLPKYTRHMLRVVYDGYDCAEIGETLGITAKIVADRIYRARRRLREHRALFHKQYRDHTGDFPTPGPDDRLAAALHQRAQQARQAVVQR
ncbi:hypothetical protein [Streptomyces sp. NPDC020362]|uniref:hypothetical protein n=1 Tax=unclassified Streptomyces TaxID=2593676 RepID=UPI0033FFCCA7